MSTPHEREERNTEALKRIADALEKMAEVAIFVPKIKLGDLEAPVPTYPSPFVWPYHHYYDGLHTYASEAPKATSYNQEKPE